MISPELKISLFQSKIFWENPVLNLRHFGTYLQKIEGEPHWIVLPETFNTGFSLKREWVRFSERTLDWMSEMAERTGAVVSGSWLSPGEDALPVNRFWFCFPDGRKDFYDKRHAFSLAGEDQCIQRGSERKIIEIKGWRIAPMVCYDLRFPVWSRYQSGVYEYDVLCYVANWPASRAHAWRQLLCARAIENQCYVVGLNRVGKDGLGNAHRGDSVIHSPMGKKIIGGLPGKTVVLSATLTLKELLEFRNAFPFWRDSDVF
jgi:omega-amidase